MCIYIVEYDNFEEYKTIHNYTIHYEEIGILENIFLSLLQGHKKVAELWGSSGLQWTDFLPKNQIEQFLIDKVGE